MEATLQPHLLKTWHHCSFSQDLLTNVAFIATACTWSTPIRSLAVCCGSKRSCYVIHMRGKRISWVILWPYTAHSCVTNQILVVLFAWFVWVCYVGEGVCVRVYARECVRGCVAWGKPRSAFAGSAGCPPSNMIQSLSNLLACDMCTCTVSTCQLQPASNSTQMCSCT